MYAIILTILICLIIILVFNNNFELFGVGVDLKEHEVAFANNYDVYVREANAERSAGEEVGIPIPNTGDGIINTSHLIVMPRMCRSAECNDRLTRWGVDGVDGEFQIIPTTFKKIINKINEIN